MDTTATNWQLLTRSRRDIYRTLRRSDREWVQLDEELEAVRAYLHIEQARAAVGIGFCRSLVRRSERTGSG